MRASVNISTIDDIEKVKIPIKKTPKENHQI